MRYYVTADVHGFYTPLITALTKAGFFADSALHKLVILGDLFDRGKEALKLQAFLSELLDQDKVILIRGNHEDLFEELVTVDTGLPYRHHVDNGTYDTALQLTGFDPRLAPTLHDDFAEVARNGKRCGFSKRYFLVLVACRHLTCTKTECRKMFLSLIAPLTTIRLNRGKRSNRLPYIFAQGQER